MTGRNLVAGVIISAVSVILITILLIVFKVHFSKEQDNSVRPKLLGCYGFPERALITIDDLYIKIAPSKEKFSFEALNNSDGVSALPTSNLGIVERNGDFEVIRLDGRPRKLRLVKDGSELLIVVAGNRSEVATLMRIGCGQPN
jgi:hypothetical protein